MKKIRKIRRISFAFILFLFFATTTHMDISETEKEVMKKACEEGDVEKVKELLKLSSSFLEVSLNEVFFFFFLCLCFWVFFDDSHFSLLLLFLFLFLFLFFFFFFSFSFFFFLFLSLSISFFFLV